ncbi:RNA-binding motif protein 25 isoform X1 [Cucumis melo]|uniref:RNA-binding motif protein 25 isoform X1 n=2 Tax=Cucumis melo TaxID=3656 RepID=A0A1S3BEI5_CUCME|nr:RNA-binding motif protein 25 isoform X1 [Cucumis melo]
MADSSSSPATLDSNPQPAEPENPNSQPIKPESAASSFPPPQSLPPTSLSVGINPTLHPPLVSTLQPPLSYAPSPLSGTTAVPPTAPSFRPVPLSAHHFSPMPGTGMLNPSYSNPGVQPPGVSSVAAPAPGMVSGGTGAVPVPVPQPMMAYQVPPGQVPNPVMRPYATMPNGFAAVPTATPQGAFPLPGVPRFPSPYPAMIRGPFPPRPPGAMGMVPAMPRPPIPGIPGVRPIIPPVVRPAVLPSVTPAEKPQTTIYIGRIAQSVDNDFMLSLLQLCGPVKSWKRAQDPSDGTPRTFGFCEFESAEGVLRALRLLTKLNIDGQELGLKGTQATRDYLKRYVEKKAENSKKLKETQTLETKEEEADTANVAKKETSKPSAEDSKEDHDSGEKDFDIACSAVLSDEDRDADREAKEKITNALEERLKSRPLPPPPLLTTTDVSDNSSVEPSAKLKDGEADGDTLKPDAADDRNDEDTTSDHKQASEHDKPETSSPDRSRRYDRRSRERDRERDLKRDKEREIERYERETERERARKEREQRRKFEEAERQYEECLKEWEYREREREKQRQYEKEREKEKERKRKKEILYDEDDEDDDSRRKWRRGALEEKRKKRSREKEDDSFDREKEEEEIAEAKRKAEEEQLQKLRDPPKLLPGQTTSINEKTVIAEESTNEIKVMASERESELDSSCDNHIGDGISQNGSGDELNTIPSETRQSGGLPGKRLGFGLVGSGKRTAVPSVFHEEEDDEAHKEKKMRPLVPIDYSAEELQAVQPASTGALPPNLAAAAEFAKRISNANSKEEKPDSERERGRRPSEKSGHRDRNDEDTYRSKDENKATDRDRERDHVLDKVKTPDNKKLLDAKQLIDMIPKTKEELFSYDINWAIYEKHALHERMRPWISKKITEFLGEEETTLVDYIVSSTQEHVKASQMLELLQSILDEEAEMFVLKMWRMLIFEIKKVETGLAFRTKA